MNLNAREGNDVPAPISSDRFGPSPNTKALFGCRRAIGEIDEILRDLGKDDPSRPALTAAVEACEAAMANLVEHARKYRAQQRELMIDFVRPSSESKEKTS